MRTEDKIDYEEAYNRAYLGLTIKKHREKLGLDAETIAEQAGFSIYQYTMMEEGKRQISIDDYFRVADVWYAYEDAEYPAFQRKIRQYWRAVKRQFLLWELQIEHLFPGAKALFDEIPLRYIVAFILLARPLLKLIANLDLLYWVGYVMGRFYRDVSDFLG